MPKPEELQSYRKVFWDKVYTGDVKGAQKYLKDLKLSRQDQNRVQSQPIYKGDIDTALGVVAGSTGNVPGRVFSKEALQRIKDMEAARSIPRLIPKDVKAPLSEIKNIETYDKLLNNISRIMREGSDKDPTSLFKMEELATNRLAAAGFIKRPLGRLTSFNAPQDLVRETDTQLANAKNTLQSLIRSAEQTKPEYRQWYNTTINRLQKAIISRTLNPKQ